MQDIEYLKNERRILDYELVEERFHYESIAARKSNSKAKALNALFLAVPATVIVLLCLKMILHSMRVGLVNSGVVGGVGILFSTFGIAFGGLASIILWRKFFSEMFCCIYAVTYAFTVQFILTDFKSLFLRNSKLKHFNAVNFRNVFGT